MTVLEQEMNLGDLLKYEAPHLYSRDLVTVADGQTLALGAVIGLESATGKAQVFDPIATDGTEIPAGILVQASASSGSDEEVPAIVRHAIVADHALVWPDSITAEQQLSATTQLKNSGILIRKGA